MDSRTGVYGRLIVLKKDGSYGGDVTLGRSNSNTIRITTTNVSRNHCKLSICDDKVYIVNFSGNCTLINESILKKDERQRLLNNDTITIDTTMFIYQTSVFSDTLHEYSRVKTPNNNEFASTPKKLSSTSKLGSKPRPYTTFTPKIKKLNSFKISQDLQFKKDHSRVLDNNMDLIDFGSNSNIPQSENLIDFFQELPSSSDDRNLNTKKTETCTSLTISNDPAIEIVCATNTSEIIPFDCVASRPESCEVDDSICISGEASNDAEIAQNSEVKNTTNIEAECDAADELYVAEAQLKNEVSEVISQMIQKEAPVENIVDREDIIIPESKPPESVQVEVPWVETAQNTQSKFAAANGEVEEIVVANEAAESQLARDLESPQSPDVDRKNSPDFFSHEAIQNEAEENALPSSLKQPNSLSPAKASTYSTGFTTTGNIWDPENQLFHARKRVTSDIPKSPKLFLSPKKPISFKSQTTVKKAKIPLYNTHPVSSPLYKVKTPEVSPQKKVGSVKKVWFGPLLKPEIFDTCQPVSSPVRKGGVPCTDKRKQTALVEDTEGIDDANFTNETVFSAEFVHVDKLINHENTKTMEELEDVENRIVSDSTDLKTNEDFIPDVEQENIEKCATLDIEKSSDTQNSQNDEICEKVLDVAYSLETTTEISVIENDVDKGLKPPPKKLGVAKLPSRKSKRAVAEMKTPTNETENNENVEAENTKRKRTRKNLAESERIEMAPVEKPSETGEKKRRGRPPKNAKNVVIELPAMVPQTQRKTKKGVVTETYEEIKDLKRYNIRTRAKK